MKSPKISSLQSISAISIFLFGSTSVLGLNFEAEQDSWIAFLIAIILSLIVALLYARIVQLYKSKSLYDISVHLFGTIIGKIICVIYIWYSLHLGALVIYNFTIFSGVSLLPETPIIPIILLILLTSAYLAKSGIESLGKWSMVILPFITIVVIGSTFAGADIIEFDNLKPILEHDAKTLLPISLKIIAFPFAESILFLTIFDFLDAKSSSYKIYLTSFLIAGGLLLIVVLRNILTLGADLSKYLYFPSYITARLINIGDFLSRVETIITANLFLAGIAKICVCIISASRGFAKLLNLKDWNELIIPTSLFMFTFCLLDHSNIMEWYFFAQIYHIYTAPVLFVIPVIIWIAAEIKTRKSKSNQDKNKVKVSLKKYKIASSPNSAN
ncbi:MAG TPA: endospore germination permease [Clostridiales bacterium]|nr:endospore germination permease [Clostridiales bacterium]